MLSKLLKTMKDDLHKAMKLEIEMRKTNTTSGTIYEACIAVKNIVRSIISMYPEIGIKPENATDEQTIKLLKKYISIEKVRELYIQHILSGTIVMGISASKLNVLQKQKIIDLGDKLTSMKIQMAQTYIPEINTFTANEIHEWIKRNINWDDYKNRIQAMGPTMKHFKGADGNVVRKIIEGYIQYDE
jgi:hypothetical protein